MTNAVCNRVCRTTSCAAASAILPIILRQMPKTQYAPFIQTFCNQLLIRQTQRNFPRVPQNSQVLRTADKHREGDDVRAVRPSFAYAKLGAGTRYASCNHYAPLRLHVASNPPCEFCGRQISIAKEMLFAPSARVLQCKTQRGRRAHSNAHEPSYPPAPLHNPSIEFCLCKTRGRRRAFLSLKSLLIRLPPLLLDLFDTCSVEQSDEF